MAGEIEVGRAAVRIIADDTQFWASIRRLQAASVGDIKVNADADTADAKVKIKDLKRESASADDTINIDVDRRGMAALESTKTTLGELAGGLRSIGTLARAAQIPFLLAGIGAIPAIASAAAVAVGQLAIGLSQGLAGAAGVGGVAVGGLVAGLVTYQGVISRVIADTRKAYEATHEHAMQQLEDRRNTILNTHAATRFNEQLNKQILHLTRIEAAIGRVVLPALTRLMNVWERRVPQLRAPLMRLVEGVTRVGESFGRALAEGERFSRLRRVLGFIASSGVRAAVIAKQLGLALLAAVQPVLPLAAGLQRRLVGISRALREWAESARGQRQIATFFQNAWQRAQQLWRIVVNLGRGFRNLFRIVAPGVNNMMGGLERLSRSFARLGAKGTESRRRIQEFVNQSKPILAALGNLVGTLVREFFKLAGGVARLERGKRHVNVLAQSINRLAGAIPPIRRLLQTTFADLGPLMGPLIKQVAKFFKVFAGSTDTLVQVVKIMTGIIRQFNKLPEPIKHAVAELVALRIVAKLLGVTVLVKLAASLGKAALGLAGWVVKAGAARGAGRLLAGSFGFLARTAATRLLGVGGLIDIVARVVIEIIGRWDWLRDRLEDFAGWLQGTWAMDVINFFHNLPNALRSAIAQGIRGTPILGPMIAEAESLMPRLKELWGIHSPSTVMRNIGIDLIQGFINGMKERWADARRWIESIAKSIPDSVRKMLDSHSPSRVMHKIGRDAAQGFLNGLHELLPRIVEEARRIAQAAEPPTHRERRGGGGGGRGRVTRSPGRESPRTARMFDYGDISQRKWDRLLSRGWQGRAGDSVERIYAPMHIHHHRTDRVAEDEVHRQVRDHFDRLRRSGRRSTLANSGTA